MWCQRNKIFVSICIYVSYLLFNYYHIYIERREGGRGGKWGREERKRKRAIGGM
jgi:hypothetical protein